MCNRRHFLAMSAAVSAMPLQACSNGGMDAYNQAVAQQRAAPAPNSDITELVRFATLAPNGHNTQPWQFLVSDDKVRIQPDHSRRTPVVDPDDHHLFVSLGCAAETLLIAARAYGRDGEISPNENVKGGIDINLRTAAAQGSLLYDAIAIRQSTRSEYDARAVPTSDLKHLEAAANVEGVAVEIITDEARRETVLGHVIEGNSVQIDNPAFVQELKHWIRFNPGEALETRDGLFTASSGNPTLPGWIGRRMFNWFFDKDAENDKYAKHLRSSAGVAVFVGEQENADHWIRVGRSFQRFALQATALGIRHAHINQPIEVPSVRSRFASWLGISGRRPDLVVRFGYAPPLPMSMRRPVEDVIG